MRLRIQVMVVDDEPLSREELKHLLCVYEQIELVGEADCGESALEKIVTLEPDVVFLDIEMAEMSGLSLAKMLQRMKQPPSIVFATAYPNYAVEAFRCEAVDYLLKPFDEGQIRETIWRLIRKFEKERPAASEEAVRKLAVEEDDGIVYVSPHDILYCCREIKDTLIVTKQKTYYTKVSLKDLEQKLKGNLFFRPHKSYLVNVEKIAQLTPWFNGAYQLSLEGTADKIPVSRNYVKALRQRLEL
ncbi:LytTR family DNA-binding domain-containing protein [Anoxybacillus rupiensis]|jgi:two-component system, LytTR family, response regulator LytT|uniref:LytTR family DNA-binding domain-containing protein n=1 Tax=Anoxybacteroides rupiense TaxID=311460 RepID=A0ABD5ITR6_9BACL|nr:MULTISPECIES: LytTR family DNA-binding domain-containing protein [Anoxybacillus]MBS2772429.1 response regulator transcription factor [Anoxybacillus rupiensis]MDE8564014.1 LytTR family DNA-binding domain-containing protein [Anoxybacillus rupiensis]MED5051593.1 LytTR family DNA-binding domain-containing protein [Anoxybacillus rupiensis]OQM45796.1 DNA-binding response regulator [Anoxybacillus sp. UARK-01]QHC03935.1 response regulator [Anoxybacillus sp. PDR2]